MAGGGRAAQANMEETDRKKYSLSGSSWQLNLKKGAPGDQGVRSAMPAASQLPGKGPTDVDAAPAPAS